ncbi:MAG: ZIP family metal transporter [Candidatus Woesearchaeota archaeon]
MLLLYILASVLVVSIVSLVGVLTFALNKKTLNNILFILVSFAAGALLGAAFLDIIPEAVEHAKDGIFGLVLAGIVFFFVIETFLYWYHCHSMQCERHSHIRGGHHHVKLPFTYLNLIGDGVHNFLDGVIIATSYLVSIPLGIVTTLAVLFHEIPQEIGDFGILIYGGFSRLEAIAYNFLSALVAVVGAVVAYFFSTLIENITPWLLPFAAGGFIYIASVDLLPELHQQQKFKKTIIQFVFFALGICVMWALTKFVVHAH